MKVDKNVQKNMDVMINIKKKKYNQEEKNIKLMYKFIKKKKQKNNKKIYIFKI